MSVSNQLNSLFEEIASQNAAHITGGCSTHYYYSYRSPYVRSSYSYRPSPRMDARPSVTPSFETAANSFDEALFI